MLSWLSEDPYFLTSLCPSKFAIYMILQNALSFLDEYIADGQMLLPVTTF